MEANENLDKLSWAKIVRLSDGGYSIGSECFFPSDGIEHDDVLPRVDAGVYTSGKKKVDAKKFLEHVGVREVSEADQVQAILKKRYSQEAEIPDDKTYRRDLKSLHRIGRKGT